MTQDAVRTRLVALGDSLTEGIGDPVGDGVRGWVPSFAASLRSVSPDAEVHNLAFRGRVTRDVAATQLARALELEPDLVTCLTGGNDVLFRPASTQASLHDDVTALLSPFAGTATIVIGSIPDFTVASPWFRRGPYGRAFQVRLDLLNAVLAQVADELDAVFVDLHAASFHAASWSIDRLHPSALGHWRIARAMAMAVGLPEPPPLEHPSTPLGHVARSARELDYLARRFFTAPGSPTLRDRVTRPGRRPGPTPG